MPAASNATPYGETRSNTWASPSLRSPGTSSKTMRRSRPFRRSSPPIWAFACATHGRGTAATECFCIGASFSQSRRQSLYRSDTGGSGNNGMGIAGIRGSRAVIWGTSQSPAGGTNRTSLAPALPSGRIPKAGGQLEGRAWGPTRDAGETVQEVDEAGRKAGRHRCLDRGGRGQTARASWLRIGTRSGPGATRAAQRVSE